MLTVSKIKDRGLRLGKKEAMANSVESKKENVDFLNDPVVQSLPANAGNTGSNPGSGGFHMPRVN